MRLHAEATSGMARQPLHTQKLKQTKYVESLLHSDADRFKSYVQLTMVRSVCFLSLSLHSFSTRCTPL
jgi:hypothetical protein